MFNCNPLNQEFNKKKKGIDRENLLTCTIEYTPHNPFNHPKKTPQNWMKNKNTIYISNMRNFRIMDSFGTLFEI